MSNKNNIVYIKVDQVINESSLINQEQEHLDSVKKILESGAAEAEKNYTAMTTKEAEQARQADAQLLNQQWVIEQQNARIALLRTVKPAIEKLRTQEGYSLVLDGAAVFGAAQDSDVSNQLAEILKDTKVEFPPLPEVTQNKN